MFSLIAEMALFSIVFRGLPNRFLFYQIKTISLQLPKECSFREKDRHCDYPPSEVISVIAENDEYMVGVVCSKHKAFVRKYIKNLQLTGQIPTGTIGFQDIKTVNTSCMKIY
jgi:hypothetical protein